MSKEISKTKRIAICAVLTLLTALVLSLVPAETFFLSKISPVLAGENDGKKKESGASINKSKLSLAVGETANLYIEGLKVGDKVTYSSSKKKTATVSASGRVSAKKKGTTVITATVTHSNGKKDSYKCNVTVSKAKKASGIKFKEINDKNEFRDFLTSDKDGAYKLNISMAGISTPIVIRADIVLDLNGQMLRGVTDGGMFVVLDGAGLTLMDTSSKKGSTLFNTGKGGIVDCAKGGTLVVDAGNMMSEGERVIYTEGNTVVKNAVITGSNQHGIYVKDGTLKLSGGSISTQRGITVEGGLVEIDDFTIESSETALYSHGGLVVINGGTIKSFGSGFSIFLNGGTVCFNDGKNLYDSAGVYALNGKMFVNGGEIATNKPNTPNSYGIYAADIAPDNNVEITVNGGKVTAGYAGAFFRNVEGSVVINGGTITSTGSIGLMVQNCSVAINGGKLECADKVCFFNNEKGDYKVSVGGGTFTGDICIEVAGNADVSITNGKYNSGSFGLVINSGFGGTIDYKKKLFDKVLDARKGGEKDSTDNLAGYRKIDVEYKEGMRITDLNTLYSVYCLACEKLIPTLEFETTDELYRIMMDYSDPDNPDVWRRPYEGYLETSSFSVINYYVTPQDVFKKYVITWDYGKEHQIYSLSKDKSLYNKVDKDVKGYSDEVDDILDEIITGKMTDREKITAVNNYMCDNYEYAKPILPSDHSFHAMLDDGTGVCQAYASLFHIMMLKLGITDELIAGEATSTPWGSSREAHMWNRVFLDNEWLYVDVTWNDGSSERDKFLLKSEKDFYTGTHFPD